MTNDRDMYNSVLDYIPDTPQQSCGLQVNGGKQRQTGIGVHMMTDSMVIYVQYNPLTNIYSRSTSKKLHSSVQFTV